MRGRVAGWNQFQKRPENGVEVGFVDYDGGERRLFEVTTQRIITIRPDLNGSRCQRSRGQDATQVSALRRALRRFRLVRMATTAPLVGIIMGSTSDWETMQHAAATLERLGVPFEKDVVSAHRTPDKMAHYAKTAEVRGLRVIIAGAGGAAHLPGMTAAFTALPVLGVPVESHSLKGQDSLLSIVQMPGGIPVATFAIGKPGAINAALFAASILAGTDATIRVALEAFRADQTAAVLAAELP
jgi:5-(carboxyamino)imidazole ribonucleotide mutase